MNRQNLLKTSYTKEEKDNFKRDYKKYKEDIKSGDWKKIPYNEFLTIIKDTALPLETKDPVPFCPFCKSDNIQNNGISSTLVGSWGKYDINHHWCSCTCNNCSKTFTMEYKGTDNGYNVWYTEKGKLLSGIPSCFEKYIYTCKCGGNVQKEIKESRGYTITTIGQSPKPEHLFKCDSCNAEVLSTTEYYSFESPFVPRKPFKHIRWRFYEEIGTSVINDKALDRIEE